MKKRIFLLMLYTAFFSSYGQILDEDYFNALKASKQLSNPDFEWRQFGPGNSGYCEEFWVHPTDPDCYYMSPDLSNTYGTFDNGERWQTIKEIDGNGRGMRRVQAITFSHQDPNLGYATNVRGFLYKSTNKGRSWNKILELQEGRHSELVVDPSDDNNWYIGAGDFWNVKGYHRNLANPQGNIDRFIAYGHIYRSVDKGDTWQQIIVDPAHENDLSIGVIIVDPQNSNSIIAGTNFGLYKSSDKGLTWQLATVTGLPHNLPRDMDYHIDRSNPSNPVTTLYLVEQTHYTPNGNTVSATGGVYKSVDFGETWTSITGNLGVRFTSDSNSGNDNADGVDNFTSVDKYYRSIAYWLGIDKNQAKTTYNQLPATTILSVYNRLIVNPVNKNELYIAFNSKHDFSFGPGDVWKTEDGGQNWFPCVRTGKYWNGSRDDDYWSARNSPNNVNTKFAHLEREMQESEEFSGCRFLEINKNGEVFISIDQQTFRSKDNGSSWQQIDDIETSPGSKKWIGRGDSNLPGRFILTETGVPGRKLLCSGEHGLWQTVPHDDYPNADELTVAAEQIEGQNNPNGAHSIASVAVHPNDPNTIFTLQFRQKHRGYLRKSVDGGVTWDNMAFPFEGDYSGTNESLQHIFQYNLLIRPDLPDRMYFCVMENPVAEVNASFRIVTRDADFGVRRSFDGGQTWVSANDGLPAKPSVRRIAFNLDKPWQMYAALNISKNGTTGGLYVSDNSGQFWNKVTIPAKIKSVNNVFVDTHKNAGNLNDIYISCGQFQSTDPDEGGVWKSADDGVTWKKIFDMPYVWQTETSPVDPNIITVNVPVQDVKGRNVTIFNPGAYVSFDGGSTWEKISNDLGQPDLITDLKPDPEEKNIFWLALKGSAWAKGIYRGGLLSVSDLDASQEQKIRIYPNPVIKDEVVIESKYLSLDENIKLEIFNLQGQLIKTYADAASFFEGKVKISFADLTAGTYLVKIKTNDKTYIKKLIKK
ncbi:T9SS type A sorting domain-containing protein [Aquimarina sp. RZ0]|uniref:T9SS type A sorting domain-containing protein n=1 Tax=Aquimarina sp. RZ0 TaxID=2607730 RepID=UPI0011F2DC97|nr:T9SS type A sorting domain-containing protein [Aquimarina sp. RZ0]KAA1245388.1 T9SS type A sorting domain-containing protein [Aquimarina sp. RZ0]